MNIIVRWNYNSKIEIIDSENRIFFAELIIYKNMNVLISIIYKCTEFI